MVKKLRLRLIGSAAAAPDSRVAGDCQQSAAIFALIAYPSHIKGVCWPRRCKLNCNASKGSRLSAAWTLAHLYLAKAHAEYHEWVSLHL